MAKKGEMSKKSKDEEAETGNKQTVSACKFQAVRWVCTIHNYPDNILSILSKTIVPHCSKYIFYKEEGEENSPHIQGAFILKMRYKGWNGLRQSQIYKTIGLDKMFYLDKMEGKWNDQQYCLKEGGEGITNSKFRPKRDLKLIQEEDMREFQKLIVEIIRSEPDDRTLWWFFGPPKLGKTQLCKYLSYHYQVVALGGEKRHMLSQAFKADKDVDFVVPLSFGDNLTSYRACEAIKDGYFAAAFGTDCNGMCIRPACHFIVIGNRPPCINKDFHTDKWKVVEIKEDYSMKPYIIEDIVSEEECIID